MNQTKKVVSLVGWILLLLLVVFSSSLPAQTIEETLKKDYPAFVFDSVMPTPVKGIYAVVYAGHEIVYYLPESGILITGEMIARGGINMTEELKGEIMSSHYKEIPLDRGIKMGTGPHTVVEITDPNCPYCRHGAQYFAGRPDVTRYVFFWPLNPDSEQKVRHILCAADRVKTYEEVMAGKYDEGATLSICQDAAVDETIKFYKELGKKIGMTGTPVYFINGRAVRGANIPLIEVFMAEDTTKEPDAQKMSEVAKTPEMEKSEPPAESEAP
ncbi:MAG: DsbC family protein [Syntrophaceae bacterium]|nr:DsbC family protein [Syntrophaceae bacterium]